MKTSVDKRYSSFYGEAPHSAFIYHIFPGKTPTDQVKALKRYLNQADSNRYGLRKTHPQWRPDPTLFSQAKVDEIIAPNIDKLEEAFNSQWRPPFTNEQIIALYRQLKPGDPVIDPDSGAWVVYGNQAALDCLEHYYGYVAARVFHRNSFSPSIYLV